MNQYPLFSSSTPGLASAGISIYIHFPFCLYKCLYCDFNSYALAEDHIPFAQYIKSLECELDLRNRFYQESGSSFFRPGSLVKTVFIGGGTPSLMSCHDIELILGALSRYFILTPETEVTLEANPKTITAEKLSGFKKAGINRLSIGIQSLHDRYLSAWGRIHSADDGCKALDLVAQAGFMTWNADLIFGFPQQTLQEWEQDLSKIVTWKPPHLSCYALTVEPQTPYGKRVDLNKAPRPSEELQARIVDDIPKYLMSTGLCLYEISNYAMLGHQSCHNLNYWNYGPYLGLGAGAVSYFHYGPDEKIFGRRSTNLKLPQHYMESVLKGVGQWFDEEEILTETAMGEFMMMGLRLKAGIDKDRFKKMFAISIDEKFSEQFEICRQKGWMNPQVIALNDQGRLFSNQAAALFIH